MLQRNFWLWAWLWLVPSKFALAEIDSAVELRSSQYLDAGQSYFRDGAGSSLNSFYFSIKGSTKGKQIQSTWDIDTEYSTTEDHNYFRPHSGYLSRGEFALGRKPLTWSAWERRWGQALVQSRFVDDRLRNSDAGLVGAFYDHQGEYARVQIVASPIFIPEIGPNYSIENQHFASRNPWFQPPRSSVSFQGQQTNINYSIDQGSLVDIANRPGGGAIVEWKPTETTLARVSEAFVPMSQMMLGFPINGRFNLDNESMDVKLTPRFLYHNVLNADFISLQEQNEWGLSVADDNPLKDHLPESQDWELQRITNAIIASAYYTHFLDERHSLSMTGSLLKIWGGDLPDQGEIQSSKTLFNRRFDYTEAASLNVHKEWKLSPTVALLGQNKLLFDRLENGFIYSGDLAAEFNHTFSIQLAFDFFGILPGAPAMPDGFIEIYRGNDRFSLGMSYVF